MSDMDALLKKHARVMRACFAHGEQGDWDVEAVVRQLIKEGMTLEDAEDAMRCAAADGVIVITAPSQADILQFKSGATQ